MSRSFIHFQPLAILLLSIVATVALALGIVASLVWRKTGGKRVQ
jgi:hypothetical protein